MKYRKGFVSNSSSSSFIIKGKENIEKAKYIINNNKHYQYDYYQLEDILYTSIISDGDNIYNELYDLASDDVSCGHNYPYDEENFVEFEGERGVNSVYIEELNLPDYVAPEVKGKKLYQTIKDFVNFAEITEEDFDYKLKYEPEVSRDLLYFLGSLIKIAGFYKE